MEKLLRLNMKSQGFRRFIQIMKLGIYIRVAGTPAHRALWELQGELGRKEMMGRGRERKRKKEKMVFVL